MATPMQIEAYKKLKSLPVEQLTWEECKMMDKLLRDEALRILRSKLGRRASRPVAKFAHMMAMYHYGSVEVDEFITQMEAWPEWR